MTMTAPEPPKPASAWEVLPLGRSAWRICDRSRAHSDGSRLVAYVDRNETGTLEVLWLRSPCPNRSRYRDLNELLSDLDAAIVSAEPPRFARPKEIPHFPPID